MLSDEDRSRRKRGRDLSACDDYERQPSAKRRKITSPDYPPEFWDVLSKITITRKALKEFDRRTTEEKFAPAARPAKRTARFLRSDTRRLACFASNGGPDLSNLRGYAELPNAAAAMSQSSSQASSRTGKRTRDSGLSSSQFTGMTTTTGPYDPQFEQMLIDRGIYPDGYEDPSGVIREPENIEAIRHHLAESRSSLSPSRFTEGMFKDFQRNNRRAKSESKAMATVIPMIVGTRDNQCTTEDNTLFNNFEKFDHNLRMLQPDKYYGARPSQIDPKVRADLGGHIIPSTRTTLPAAPNYFLEGKSASGRSDVLQRQIMHDNAYGARAMFQLQNYGNTTPVYDGNAYTLGSTYHPGEGTLKVYATHPRQSASGGMEYHMTQLRAYAMTDTAESFRQGAVAYRNARDFTQEQRDRLIADANAVAKTIPTVATPSSVTGGRSNLSSATASGSFDSDTSTDELAPDYEERPKRQRRHNTRKTDTPDETGKVLRKQPQQPL